MDVVSECEENDVDALHNVSSAAPSTPNSNRSSPATGNDENMFHLDLYVQGSSENGDPLLSVADSKNISKRGPGRPRKDIPQCKGILKRKSPGEQNQCSDRVGIPALLSPSESSNIAYPDEKAQNAFDDISNIYNCPEKICCLCNLDEKTSLGQGDFLKWEVDPDNCEKALQFYDENTVKFDESLRNNSADHVAFRRSKSMCKGKLVQNDCFNELDKIGHFEKTSLKALFDVSYIHLHRMCLMWSQGVYGKTNDLKTNIEMIIAKSLTQKCSFCGQYGASVTCKMSCSKVFHLPCAAASGSFQIMDNFTVFCVDHIEQVTVICPDANITCHNCSTMAEITKMVMCSTCGEHFHTNCVGLINTPETRAGWNCSNCRKCQICREGDGTEGRFIKCEQCQRLYHNTCLRPTISSLPKYGWKCNRCRVCTDCGSRTPGGGTSSRWHCHYTICDSCYQQRNKGFSCPICHKAYRASAHKEMVKCSLCHRFVHSTCDEEADLIAYHKKKESNPDYDYICPQCKLLSKNEKATTNQLHQIRSVEGAVFSQGLEDNFIKEIDFENFQKESGTDFIGLESHSSKICRKKIFFRGRGGKLMGHKNNILTHFGRKRNVVRGKGRQLLLNHINIPSNGDRPLSGNKTSDDGLSMERKILLCSAKDKFLLSQDLCVMCGSAGIDIESKLIACAQCGQCYHPYCVNTKISDVILEKGWRCLDCTVCETCGQRNDEARLILCDECDLSYHIYCVSPPLETVPHGNWKCKWCAACQKCGRQSPGANQQRRNTNNGLLECGRCSSREVCSACFKSYNDGELIIQCKNCERWLHCRCDSINTEEEAQICDNVEYHCILCRPKDKSLAQFLSSKTLFINKTMPSLTECSSKQNNDAEATFWVDGVSMSERGANMIKALSSDIKKKRKMRATNESQNKESGILAAIESVVAGSNSNVPSEEFLETESMKKKDIDQYKDGMVWLGADNSPPEGFSISTNDDGIAILRKKRQRNLQKIGIGGFSVRNRTVKKDESSLNSNNCSSMDPEKRKKAVRKKVKSRLSESYPAYLQEAFFGKPLLESMVKNQLACEDSDISDELVDLNEAIFHEEALNPSPKTPTALTITNDDQTNISTKENCNKILNVNKTISIDNDNEINVYNSITVQETSSNSKLSTSQFDTNNTGNKTEDKLRDSSFSNTPMTGAFPADISNESCTSITNSNGKGQILAATDDHGVNRTHSESLQSADFRTIVLPKEIGDVNLLTRNNNENGTNTPFVSQQPDLKESQEQTSQIQMVPINVPIHNSTHIIDGAVSDNMVIPHSQYSQQLQKPQIKSAPQQTDSAGTQKTAEKMRRDEDLGEMATISAVLYANTRHPELKQIYPNWNDRCKQILKRWRSLSNEKKAPFLQQAKDNRSALRMRRSQQDQERICFNQKSLKEQEQERIWKQHQAKAKESHNNLTYRGHAYDLNGAYEMVSIDKREVVHNGDVLQKRTQQQPSQKEQNAIDNPAENKHLRTLLLKEQQLRTTTTDPWISNPVSMDSPNSFYQHSLTNELLPRSSKPALFTNIGNKHGWVEESKTSQPLESVQLEQQTVCNENKQVSKGRKDMKASDSGDSELEKMDADENGAFGDILGGLGDGNDDDLLKSLTAEIGDDFNILAYADPALDELASNPNLLNKLDFE
ncbi:histone-lysine N-methyltransferase 2C [Ceratitis capitata]|uniref:histone-lysine N-methyltransferase 2C n=1 Tax=Ceratitis capitata TaxID=7213 RepID=UPI000329CFDF|nr:histone-lysine N-methyltransferase 2C [Ceratitis capitata]